MANAHLLLLIIGLLFSVLAAVRVPDGGRVMWLGLALVFLFLALIFSGGPIGNLR